MRVRLLTTAARRIRLGRQDDAGVIPEKDAAPGVDRNQVAAPRGIRRSPDVDQAA
jgi:hypothetical protein